MEEQYIVQDSRSYVGNDILWWANGGGYTTDVSKAEIFTKDSAVAQHNSRESDIPWPKHYIDARVRPACDMQYVEIKEALKGTGVKLIKPKPYVEPKINCHGCGRFMTERMIFNGDCPNCGADNRP